MNEPTQNDGGTAFPIPYGQVMAKDGKGMSLRDYFAGQALAGYIANPQACAGLEAVGKNSPEIYAMLSYAIADAMLEARAAK